MSNRQMSSLLEWCSLGISLFYVWKSFIHPHREVQAVQAVQPEPEPEQYIDTIVSIEPYNNFWKFDLHTILLCFIVILLIMMMLDAAPSPLE